LPVIDFKSRLCQSRFSADLVWTETVLPFCEAAVFLTELCACCGC
jgi:hypothetical protein